MKGIGIEWDSTCGNPLSVMEKPCEFWVGRVVQRISDNMPGHIDGFRLNLLRQVIVSVRFADEDSSRPIHPSNINLL